MKRKTAIILALAILIGVLFSGCGEGIGLGDETLVFEKGEASCTVKEFSNKSSITEFEIPDEYEGLPVTEIADFSGCNLENAEVIKIGKNVSKIGSWAFENNQKLKMYVVDPENEYYCSVDGVLFTKDMKQLLFYPLAKDVTEVEKTASDGKTQKVKESTYTVPDGVEIIATKAFYKCSVIKEIVLPDSVTEIREKAFFKCSAMENFSLPENVTLIEKDAFGYCSSLKEITIPKGVTAIGDYAFFNCTNLLTVNMKCSQDSVSLGKDWQPTNNGLKIDALNINWE